MINLTATQSHILSCNFWRCTPQRKRERERTKTSSYTNLSSSSGIHCHQLMHSRGFLLTTMASSCSSHGWHTTQTTSSSLHDSLRVVANYWHYKLFLTWQCTQWWPLTDTASCSSHDRVPGSGQNRNYSLFLASMVIRSNYQLFLKRLVRRLATVHANYSQAVPCSLSPLQILLSVMQGITVKKAHLLLVPAYRRTMELLCTSFVLYFS